MNAWSGSFGILQALILGGAFLWWAYLAGVVLAVTALTKARRPFVRASAGWSLGAQFAPLGLAFLVPVFFLFEALFGVAISNGVADLLSATAIFVGPAATLWLIMVMILKSKATPTIASVLTGGLLLARWAGGVQ